MTGIHIMRGGLTKSLLCTYLVDLAVLGLRLDSMILKVLSNANDSMILFYESIIQGNNYCFAMVGP